MKSENSFDEKVSEIPFKNSLCDEIYELNVVVGKDSAVVDWGWELVFAWCRRWRSWVSHCSSLIGCRKLISVATLSIVAISRLD